MSGKEYQQLLQRIQRRAEIIGTGDTDIEISLTLSTLIGSHNSFVFDVDWNPLAFLQDQYKDLVNTKLESVICISGSNQTAQATSCGEYIQRMWPERGAGVLGVLSTAIEKGVGVHSGTYTLHEQMDEPPLQMQSY